MIYERVTFGLNFIYKNKSKTGYFTRLIPQIRCFRKYWNFKLFVDFITTVVIVIKQQFADIIRIYIIAVFSKANYSIL